MTHCHNLDHEDTDMMVQFGVGDYLNVNDPIFADMPIIDTESATTPVYAPNYPLGT
jgi:hypothetical protein